MKFYNSLRKKNRQIDQEIHRLGEIKLNLNKAIEVMKAKLDRDLTIPSEITNTIKFT